MSPRVKQGAILALATAVISGFSIFYNKLVVVSGVDSLVFNILKNGSVAIVLSVLLVANKKVSLLTKLSRADWLKLIAIGVIGGSVPFVLYFEGLKQVSAVAANLIHKTLFVWVAMMALPLLGERLTRWQIIGYALVAWSNLFIGGFSGFKWSGAELMILGATLFWSVENIVAKIALRSADSKVVAWARMFIGSLVLVAVAAFQNKLPLLTQVAPAQLAAIAGSAVFLTGYVLTWYKALKYAPVTLVTSVLILATPVTNLLSAIFITHQLPQAQVVNLVGSLAGVALVTFLSKKITPRQPTVARG